MSSGTARVAQPGRANAARPVFASRVSRVQCGAALGPGLLADAGSLPALLETFEQSRSHASRGSLARVFGDRRAIPRLVAIVRSKQRSDWIHRRALAALGTMGQAADEAKVIRYPNAANHEQAFASLQTVLNRFSNRVRSHGPMTILL